MPSYNHTRADGPTDPCPICKADLEATENSLFGSMSKAEDGSQHLVSHIVNSAALGCIRFDIRCVPVGDGRTNAGPQYYVNGCRVSHDCYMATLATVKLA